MNFKLNLFCCIFAIIAFMCNVEGRKSSKNTGRDFFAKASGKFATDLYREVIKGKAGSVIYSPMSIQSVLSLGMLGATGATKNQMKSALNLNDVTDADIQAKYQNLTNKVKSTNGLKIANKIYTTERGQIRHNYRIIAASFDSDVQKLDFTQSTSSAKAINTWVEEKTNNKIKNLISPDTLNNETRILIVNAIYFKANWDIKFDASKTTKTPFYTADSARSSNLQSHNQGSVSNNNFNTDNVKSSGNIRVPDAIDTMNIKSRFRWGSFPEHSFTALELNYRDSDISLMLLLPNEIDGLRGLEDKIGEIDLHHVHDELSMYDTVLALPRFKIDFDIDLNDSLKKLGMQRMFTDDAEFSKILESNEGLKVSNVVHKAYIEVNEEGAEAAGSTAFYGAVQLSLPVIKNFKCDHPFMFVLKSKSQIFFMGRFTGN